MFAFLLILLAIDTKQDWMFYFIAGVAGWNYYESLRDLKKLKERVETLEGKQSLD